MKITNQIFLIKFSAILLFYLICFNNIINAQKINIVNPKEKGIVNLEKVNVKKIKKIRHLLNNFKLSEAIEDIDKLITEDPHNTYYNEYKSVVLKQIIDKIIVAKDLSEATISTGYLDSNGNKVADTLDWANDADSAMLQFVTKKNTNKDAENDTTDEVLEQYKNVKIDNLDTVKLASLEKNENSSSGFVIKRKKKKEKKIKWTNFEDDERWNQTTVFIDTNLAKKYKNSNKLKEDDENEEVKKIIDKKLNRNIDNDEQEIGFEKKKTKEEKARERELEIFNGYSSMDERVYLNMLLNNARRSTLFIENADSSSKYLREYLIDTLLTKKVWNDTALQLIEDAENDYREKEYANCLTKLNDAKTIEPNMVSIYLRMGDIYLEQNEEKLGFDYFNAAIKIDTTPNTHFQIAKYFLKKGEYQKAMDHIVQAIIIYPDKMFIEMIREIELKSGQDFYSQWIPRYVFPITTKNTGDEIIVDKPSPWYYYQQAKTNFAIYANENGILKPNEKSKERYLEVACFKQMLDSTKDVKELKFARQMRKMGYLDCYVLLSLFHIDIYSEYKDLAKNNPKKIAMYLNLLINWQKKKFDEFRNEN